MITRSSVAALLVLLAALILAPHEIQAQADSATVVAGDYQASRLQRWLLGSGYRDLWTTPMRVEVLDLARERGGIVPVERGGNVQTMALRFRAADGSEYNFRSVDKELTPALPSYAQETLLDFIRQDVTSAQMPVAPIVATPLLDAVGILNPAPRLVVLPDVEALGEFREEYGGLLGTFEHHPNEIEEGVGGFAGSIEVEPSEDMFEAVEEDPSQRIDSRAFLTARLVDLLIGDWDRHEGQWRWGRYAGDGVEWWVPIPEDRDYAFVDHGGILVAGAKSTGLDRLISFRDDYASLKAMMANSLEFNRRILADLPRPVWDSVATFVQARLSDDVIAGAVGRVPPELRGPATETLEARLRARRDRLPAIAADFYALMAEVVEVHSTDADEIAEVRRRDDGWVEVTIRTDDGVDVFHRLFDPAETHELRIDLHGGDDSASIVGPRGKTMVRLLGGGGDDHLENRSPGPAALYDSEGENDLVPGAGARVDRRAYEPPEDASELLPSSRRDWGHSFSISPAGDWRSHVGVVAGATASWTKYGFRRDPYQTRHAITGLVSPLSGRGAVEYRGALRRENSDRWLELRADATTMNAVRFHGYGNNTGHQGPESRVWLRELAAGPAWHVPLSPHAALMAGAEARYTEPRFMPASPAAELRPLGSDAFGRVHALLGVEIDSRDDRWFPTRGVEGEVTATVAPPLWDLESPYSRLDADLATYLPIPFANGPVLALRGGGASVWGDAPFMESAFLGGSHSLRGFQRERFAGDAILFGNAELRMPLFEMELLVRGMVGVSGLMDAGRVWLDGRSPGGWHQSEGASVWFATPALSLSLTYARGEDHRFYADIGLPF